MLLSLVFLPFNVYLSVDLSILPLLFLSWHFLFKSHESLTMVCKKEACTLVCIQGPESASSAQSWVNPRGCKHNLLPLSVPAPFYLELCSCWSPCHDCLSHLVWGNMAGGFAFGQTGLSSQFQLYLLDV